MKFDEPLDHGMLKRVLAIVADGRAIAGRVQVDEQETRWRFTPEKPWKAGDYSLRVRSNLEDRVGNSIARPFEVDLSGPPLPKVPKVIERRFEIAESPER